jgi:hypothetical protein
MLHVCRRRPHLPTLEWALKYLTGTNTLAYYVQRDCLITSLGSYLFMTNALLK